MQVVWLVPIMICCSIFLYLNPEIIDSLIFYERYTDAESAVIRLDYIKNGIEVFNFGKFKGRPVADVLKSEPQYYDWMMKGDFPQHTKQKLTEIFTRTMLKKS